jgi:predicted transcriptional regulator
VQHRPRLHDGTWNPDYLRARRQEKKFDTELARLQKQSACFHEFAAGTGNPAVDVFVRNLVNRLNVFADEESDIRRAARHLIESKISDRKKEIVTLLVSGWRQSDIGRKLGISRQAVSKALKSKSIPIAYRFDLVALG